MNLYDLWEIRGVFLKAVEGTLLYGFVLIVV